MSETACAAGKVGVEVAGGARVRVPPDGIFAKEGPEPGNYDQVDVGHRASVKEEGKARRGPSP